MVDRLFLDNSFHQMERPDSLCVYCYIVPYENSKDMDRILKFYTLRIIFNSLKTNVMYYIVLFTRIK